MTFDLILSGGEILDGTGDVAFAGSVGIRAGKIEAIELAVMCLLAEGHLLIEDVPGVGKTSLAKAMAASIDCSWKRVQFTPDLLPADLVGVSVYQRSTETFRFEPGPLFANIVLADEINRASPKTQSALLEAMEERQITADGISRKLEPPFMVIATQNPIDQEGTYRLPESQLDRFLLRISIGYPDRESFMNQIRHLQACGVEFKMRGNHGMTHSAYVSDPDGNGIEVLYEISPEFWQGDVAAALNYFEPMPLDGPESLEDSTAYARFDRE